MVWRKKNLYKDNFFNKIVFNFINSYFDLKKFGLNEKSTQKKKKIHFKLIIIIKFKFFVIAFIYKKKNSLFIITLF